MSANFEAKKVLVEEIKDNLKNAKSVVVLDYRGLNAAEDTKLRKTARENNVVYKVYKNRLIIRALDELGITGYNPADFEGTTSIAFGQDEVSAAKVISQAKKEFNKTEIKFGLLDQAVISKEEVEKLSKIPSKEVLIAMLLGGLNAPIAALARALDAISKKEA